MHPHLLVHLVPVLLLAAACATVSRHPSPPVEPFTVTVEGRGPPMVFIAGLSSSGEVWKDVVAHYRGSYECHVLSLAGFAGRPASEGALLPAVHSGLARYLVEHHLERPVLVGHSLGGFLALWLAQSNPALVGDLVLVDTLPFLPGLMDPSATAVTSTARADELRTSLRTATPEERARRGRMSVRGLVGNAAEWDRVSGWGIKSDPDTVADAVYYVMTHDLRPGLVKVQAPTLVVGTWLGYAPYLNRTEVLGRFTAQYRECATCRVVMADRARHFVMLDDLAGLLAEMDGFLQNATRSATVQSRP